MKGQWKPKSVRYIEITQQNTTSKSYYNNELNI